MRVLESSSKSPAEMGRKRNRKPTKEKENSLAKCEDGDEYETGSRENCNHIRKSVNLNTVKKHLHQSYAAKCENCKENSASMEGYESGCCDGFAEEDTSLWLCLQCGHLGCGRSSKHQHALEHHKKTHSIPHAIVLNTTTWVIWCYECDQELLKENKKLAECVDYAHKYIVSGGSRTDPSTKIPQVLLPTDGEGSGDDCSPQETHANQPRKNAVVTVTNNGLKVKGLRNLGNTCFFNAVMQNLSHTSGLEKVLATHSKDGHVMKLIGNFVTENGPLEEEEEPLNGKIVPILPDLDLTLAPGGAMTHSLHYFLEEMKASQNKSVNPGSLFSQVCKKAPRFKGFQQQDSHELLRQLLDGIKSEEIKRSREAILKVYGQDSGSVRNIDEETKMKIKEYGRQAKHTFVDGMFGGHLISTVLCEECKTPSQMFEAFLDLSLPIVEEKLVRRNSSKTVSNNQSGVVNDLFDSENAERLSKNQSKRNKKMAKKEKKLHRRRGGCVSLSDDTAETTDSKEAELQDGEEERGDSQENGTQDENDLDTALSIALAEVGLEPSRNMDISEEKQTPCLLAKSDSSSDLKQNSDGGSPILERPNSPKCSVFNEAENLCNSSLRESDNTEDGKILSSNSSPVLKRNNSLRGKEGKNCDNKSKHCKCLSRQCSQCCDKSRPNSPKIMENGKSTYDRELELRLEAMNPLMPLSQTNTSSCTIYSSLRQFTTMELLRDTNKFGCDVCSARKHPGVDEPGTVYTDASKQMLIYSPPAVLTLHLKRFQQVGYSLRKNNKFVEFPLELDLAPFCSSLCRGVKAGQQKIMYSLYGVVEHSGSLHGGHYTAYVKVRPHQDQLMTFMHTSGLDHDVTLETFEKVASKSTASSVESEDANAAEATSGKWYYISDSHVQESNESSVLRSEAYLLFYERVY